MVMYITIMGKIGNSADPKPKRRKSILPADRYAEVVEVAGELFLSHGYAGVSVGMIVDKIGGSNRDLYKEFGSKETLFLQVMGRVCDDLLAPLRAVADIRGDSTRMPMEKALHAIGSAFLNALLSPRVLALHRLMVGEASRFPDLARDFIDMGPNSAYRAVAGFLEARSACSNPSLSSAMFLDMLTSDLQLRALAGIAVGKSEIEERVCEAVRVFLNGVRKSSTSRGIK